MSGSGHWSSFGVILNEMFILSEGLKIRISPGAFVALCIQHCLSS